MSKCCMTEYEQISAKLLEEKNAEVESIVNEYTMKLQEFLDTN